MRTAFIEQLLIEARRNPRIFLVVGDLGYSVIEPFAREFPERYLNAGVAEQNMTGVAAGLASEGYHVFTYSIANFPTFRCAEQIRNDVAYHQLPVTVVAVGGGLSYGNLGYSHHAVQDIALMRSLPGLLLGCPGDPAETQAVVSYLSEHPQPSYLRLGKAGEPRVHAGPVQVDRSQILFASQETAGDKLLLTTAATLKLASEALALIGPSGWVLGSLPLWSEDDQAQLVAQLGRFRTIVTVEDHLRAGGFGSFIREMLDDAALGPKFRAIALRREVCGYVAAQPALNRRGGVSAESIARALQELS